uniref:Uncharacterized protein n=1 Tax=Chromera velia CCMP2878 TaxID=1169474 RepID=A0A0G4HYN0_9ALVE|eukprot:Cvel_9532.t1-p1 / transcript=Cvel_9532.t1 / gene=Cvel_9532 / organism=Chromera_velia_CCMP2878 / gene_product=hypothetical protein / transcript_product=hypothetical protein / location=Cvel_scaffold552:27726-30482(+) / protein_length=463 / sequence_SO=supercontig / SO=protein_coding / is_pseudo=false
MAEGADLNASQLAAFYLSIALFQALAGVILYRLSARYIGTHDILRLRWERGYNTGAVGAKQLPLSRFIGVVIAYISCLEYTIKAAQEFDLAAGNDIGLNLTLYQYWGYLGGCPLIMYDFTETLGIEGNLYYAVGTFAALLAAFWTEWVRGAAQWVLFGAGAILVVGMAYFAAKRSLGTLGVLRKHDVSKQACLWLLIALMTFGVGWMIFPTSWLLRSDIHSGVLNNATIAILHGVGDVVSKPLFAFFLTRYRMETENIHLKAILKGLKWHKDGTKDITFVNAPEEVLVITVPALLEHTISQKQPEEVKQAMNRLRMKTLGQSDFDKKGLAALQAELGGGGGGGDGYADVEQGPPRKPASPSRVPQSQHATPAPPSPVSPYAYPMAAMPMYPPYAMPMYPPRPMTPPTHQQSPGGDTDVLLSKVLEAVGQLAGNIQALEGEPEGGAQEARPRASRNSISFTDAR